MRTCLPVASLMAQSRAASSASVPFSAMLARSTGAPITVSGARGAHVHAATPGSVVMAITGQPAMAPGSAPLATGSVLIASGPGTGDGLLATVAGPDARRRTTRVARAGSGPLR